ncbi:hypothetical protein MACJ_004054 [Theileria orientalis]|uniref:Uncharacterized protein n=1 Tax=Theileria orientalis TaxID=68886 RepID=A0A976SL29_THEOR|nr:hypothetical protein MACJ_004054 [Theileria orientalis]
MGLWPVPSPFFIPEWYIFTNVTIIYTLRTCIYLIFEVSSLFGSNVSSPSPYGQQPFNTTLKNDRVLAYLIYSNGYYT